MNFQPPDIAPETHSAALPELPVYYLGDDGLLHEGAGLPGDGIWCKYSDVKAHLDSPAPSAESEGADAANGSGFMAERVAENLAILRELHVKDIALGSPMAEGSADAIRKWQVVADALEAINAPCRAAQAPQPPP